MSETKIQAEIVVRMYSAANGAFTVVRVETASTGRTVYSNSHQFETDARKEFNAIVDALTSK